ncbi:pescadillo homolog [Portunus trituberculatus]|uniref:pescadillo homolog n=1 Tax=Portunus trituberculatus TaxID=210409 RepID=UPI001E1D2152|nr:pescadillo homolog [Portunus trituberculatus]
MGSKRKKKGESGEAKRYITRNAAVKKLQLSLRDFRRLCILKGIYPREPKNRRKAQKGDSTIKTLYYMKDIQFLLHEPIIWKFREHRAFSLKIKHAKAKKDRSKVQRMMQNKPMYRLDHIVRERYPTFTHALRDLDDPLTLCFLFSKLPQVQRTTLNMVNMCRRLTLEFMLYVIEAQALRKVFITIKGYYYQVEIMGQTITWITPHPFTPQTTTGVDFRIMRVFVEFYITLLGFTNFRLYHHLNLHYPPTLPHADIKEGGEDDVEMGDPERLASLNFPLKRNHVEDSNESETIDTHLLEEDETRLQEAREEEKKKKQQQNLFKGLKFFLNRETNIESLTFVIRACKGEVSWDESTADGNTFPVTDETITHEIVDRDNPKQTHLSRYYIQPQWVYDCINARMLLPVQDYFPGTSLPPHLSPFDLECHTYLPPEQKQLIARQKGEIPEDKLPLRQDSDSEEENERKKKKKLNDANIRPLDSFKTRTQKRKEKKRKLAQKEATKEQEKESKPTRTWEDVSREEEAMETQAAQNGKEEAPPEQNGKKAGTEEKPKQEKKMGVHRGKVQMINPHATEKQELEEKKLAIMMIPRKKKRVYHMLRRREKRKETGARRLTQKRLAIDHEKEKAKKAKKAGV